MARTATATAPDLAVIKKMLAMQAAKIRLSLDVTPEMKEVLDDLTRSEGTTQADVLRRAVALYAAVKKARLAGEGEPAIAKNGKVVVKLVGI
jgi:hypothetical protein